MKFSEVQELLKAGFTADEIREMLTESDNPQNPQGSPQEENTNIPDTSTDNSSEKTQGPGTDQESDRSDPAGAQTENTNIPDFNQLNSTMEKLIRTIQVSNLHNNSIDSPAQQVDIDKQVDSIMAGIIRPEHEKKGD